MVSPLLILQTASFNPDVFASQLVRGAILVASAMGDWSAVDRFREELNGYERPDGDWSGLPGYRSGHARLIGTDKMGRRLPVLLEDQRIADTLSTVPIVQPLAAIEALVEGKRAEAAFEIEFHHSTAAALLQALPGCVRITRQMQGSQFVAALEGARQAVFEWCLVMSRAGRECPAHVDLSGLLPKGTEQPVVPAAPLPQITITATNSAVNVQSPSSSANVSVAAGESEVLREAVRSLTDALDRAQQSGLSPGELEQVSERLEEMRQLAAMPKPRQEWVKQAAASMRVVLEQAAGSVLGNLATPHVQALLARLAG